MHRSLRAALIVGAVALGARGLSAADDPVAKEYAALEEAFETAPVPWPEQYATFRPKYEAFAKAHPGTDLAVAAKMRLLEFTGAVQDKTAMHEEAVRRFNDVIADNPRTERLAEVPDRWYLFTNEDFGKIWQMLRAPDQPDAVKAAVTLFEARQLLQESKPVDAAAKLGEIVAKYESVPHYRFTFGAYAKALLERYEPSELAVGAPAPDVVGTGVDGKTVKLSAFRGRVVLLCFFTGGFGSRKDTYAEERALAEGFKAEKFTMFFVSQTDSPRRMQALAKAEKLTWPTVFDGNDGPIASQWGIDARPKWYLIDDLGIIRRVEKGHPATWTTAAVAALLVDAKLRRK